MPYKELQSNTTKRTTSEDAFKRFLTSKLYNALKANNMKYHKVSETGPRVTYRIEFIRLNTVTSDIDLGIVNDKYEVSKVRYINSFELNDKSIKVCS